jgi:hypothetical protein
MQRFNLKKIFKHKCYYRSLLLYNICRFFDKKSTYHINIMMHCSEKAWGHAWLTRDGRTFLIRNRNIIPFVLEKAGESKRYIFWITT